MTPDGAPAVFRTGKGNGHIAADSMGEGSPYPSGRSLMLADGRPADVLAAHQPPGSLHIAVSVQLITLDGEWLLQRRSQEKPLFAGKWANSCCTHPAPAEPPYAAAVRRVEEELGIAAVPLFPASTFTYRATDPVSGLVEHEHDHVFVGFTDLATVPDPSEIEGLWCGSFDQAMAVATGAEGAPWAPTVLRLAATRACALLPYLRRDGTLRTPPAQPPTVMASPGTVGRWS